MKKLVCMVLVCLMLLCGASALAEGKTININLDVPTSLNMSADLTVEEVDSADITTTGGVTAEAVYGWIGNKEPQDPIGSGAEYDGEEYWVWANCKPETGVKYAFLIEVETNATDVSNITVNGKRCTWQAYEDGGNIYDIYFTIGELQSNGTFKTDVPETGDATPIALLATMMVVGAAGIVVFSKRRRFA